MLIHSWLANTAKARLPAFSHNLHLDIYSISLTFSNMCQIPICRLFENARSYPSQITHQPPLLAIAREKWLYLSMRTHTRKEDLSSSTHRTAKKLNIHADSTKPLRQATMLPMWGLAYLNPHNPLFNGAHQASVRTRAQGHRFAVLRPASDDALVKPLIPFCM